LAALLFGLLPAVQSARIAPYGVLREGGRSQVGTRRSHRLRAGLVVAEVALAVLLLAGAGLLIRSFATLIEVDPGFRTSGIATFPVRLPGGAYPDDERRAIFFEQYVERVRGLGGVESVAAVSQLPLTPNTLRIGFDIDGEPPSADQTLDVRVVTPDYL